MKKPKFILLALVVTLMVFTIATAMAVIFDTPISAADKGNWKEVCCGTRCSPSDYCVGTGNYACCKATEPEL